MEGLETGGVIGMMIVLSMGLVKVIEALIAKRRNGNGTPTPIPAILVSEQERQLHELYELHHRFDDDGAPLWYVPRSWGETQKEIAKSLENVSHMQGSIVEMQKTQTEVLNKIVEKLVEKGK